MPKIWENENLVCNKNGSIEYLQFKKLLQYPSVQHAYTLKSNDLLNFKIKGQDRTLLNQSYARIADALNLEANNIIKPNQNHTSNVEIAPNIETYEEADGVLTNKKNITALTSSADCTSLLLYDPKCQVIGSIHSGWRGTLQAIAQVAIKKMINKFGSNPQDIICCICPSIRKCCFEVRSDVKELFEKKYHNLPQLPTIIENIGIKNGVQKYVIDTTKINQILLKQMGLQDENIIDSNICTVCNSKYFHSCRANRENFGLNAALICMKE